MSALGLATALSVLSMCEDNMSKPDGVTQEAWDAAEIADLEGWVSSIDGRPANIQEIIARAIMDAREDEREACALEMDRRATENANTPATQAAYRNAASAIRNRDCSNGQ